MRTGPGNTTITPIFIDGATKGEPIHHAHPLVPSPWATPSVLRQLYSVPEAKEVGVLAAAEQIIGDEETANVNDVSVNVNRNAQRSNGDGNGNMHAPTSLRTHSPSTPSAQTTPPLPPLSPLSPRSSRSSRMGSSRMGSQAVLEFGGSFDPADAAQFARTFGEPAPNITVHGHNNPSNPDTEGTMDVELMTALGLGVPTFYWNYPFDKWLLDWAADVSSDPLPPLVWSLSFGEPEATADHAEVARVNTELMKMAARGITVVSTSGDWGTGDNVNCSRCVRTVCVRERCGGGRVVRECWRRRDDVYGHAARH